MGTSPLRTASKSLKILFKTFPGLQNYRAPSFTTIKRWAQKIGYYKLKRVKEIANDWMLIIDASIQMGEKKCVVILGCRKSKLPKNYPLTLEDLEVLSLVVVPKLNGEVIYNMLTDLKLSIGEIAGICSDRGSDILFGVKQFQITNPKTRHICDTAHYVSNLLKAALEKSPRWKTFRDQITLARRKMQNSKISGALPPSPRTKARYMNIDSLLKWAVDMLVLLDQGVSNPDFEITELKKYLGWLLLYREDITHWNRISYVGVVARQIVRVEGIHKNIMESFEKSISSIKLSVREVQFANQLAEFLQNQSNGMQISECFIGSTEVLESLFGKIKYMEREQRAFGFTSLLLAAIASVGPLDDDTIIKAVQTVKLSEIANWSTTEIGQSVQSQRRQIKKIVASITTKIKKVGQEFTGIFCVKVA